MEIKNQLTQEDYQFLKEYEDRLQTAVRSKYVRAIPSGAVHKMRTIYENLIGKSYSMNEHCNGCVLTLCKKLYKPYNEYKESIERNSNRQGNTQGDDTETSSGRIIETGDTK